MITTIKQAVMVLFVAVVAVAFAFVVPQSVGAQETTDDTTTTDTTTTDTTDDSDDSSDDEAAEDESEDEEESEDEDDSSVSGLLALLQSLMEQVATLQERLNDMRSEVNEVRAEIRDNLREGMSDEDIEKIQELLATDPELYPEGLVTGYFGPLTRQAVERFQSRHELQVTGVVDEQTADFMESYLSENFGDDIPPGLLRAPGIKKKAERRLANDCDAGRGASFLCERLKGKFAIDDDVDAEDALDAIEDAESAIEKAEEVVAEAKEDGEEVALSESTLTEAKDYLSEALEKFDAENFGAAETAAEAAEDLAKDARMKFLGKTEADISDEDKEEEELEIEVEVENDVATVEIEYPNGDEVTVTYDFTTEEALIDTLVEEKDLSRDDVEAVIEFEYEDDEEDDEEDESDDESDEEEED